MSEEETGALELPKKISVDLGDNPGVVEFDTYEEVLQWAAAQQKWSEANFRKKNTHAQFGAIYDQQERPSANLQVLANSAISGETTAMEVVPEIERELGRFRNHDAVHAESPTAELLASLQNDPWALIGGLVAAIGYPSNEYVGTFANQQLGAFAGGYILTHLAFPQLRDKEAESVRVMLNNMLSTETKRFNSQHDQQKTKAEELANTVATLTGEAAAQKTALDALQNQYDQFMKLESPAKYWKDRADESKQQASFWTWIFGGVALAGILGAVFGYPPILKEFRANDGSLGAGTIGLMTAPAAIVLTTLALLFRNIAGYQRDSTAANERYTMIMTYIAFSGDEKSPIDEEHRRHILDRMFTPTTEDNATKDNPHPYIDALRQLREAAKQET